MDKILILDFGGQYNQLIARRVREQHVFAEIKAYNKITPEEIAKESYKGIIFTGGPNSVYDPQSPHCDKAMLELGIPVLGICYGAQLIAYLAGGTVSSAENSSEYGKTNVTLEKSRLFEGIEGRGICWMSHTDYISSLPEGFERTAFTEKCPIAAMSNESKALYAVQFHPEVTHTEFGRQLLSNFVKNICRAEEGWFMDSFAAKAIEELKTKLEGKEVLLALSGGVDSSVAALLLGKAIGSRLTCVFVDHGLMRKDEGDFVERTFSGLFGIKLMRIDAEKQFLNALKGVTDPEAKRKIIGKEFLNVFTAVGKQIGKVDVLAQGTIYPDVIESGKGDSAVIKSHHNVGGLPDVLEFEEIVEPLRDLFKDEVRSVGELLGLPKQLVWRQPFPGPGLGVRVTGEITAEKLEILREADKIFTDELEKSGEKASQYFAVLDNTRTVGVMGDKRTYGYTVALRAVVTDDFMTAVWARLSYELLETVSSRIVNEVAGVSRVVYDITGKPPATVEWE